MLCAERLDSLAQIAVAIPCLADSFAFGPRPRHHVSIDPGRVQIESQYTARTSLDLLERLLHREDQAALLFRTMLERLHGDRDGGARSAGAIDAIDRRCSAGR